YLICYYFQLRSKLLNQQILHIINRKTNNMFHILREQNIICSQIKLFNSFWKKYYFYLIMTLMPMNLFILIMALFVDLNYFTLIMYLGGALYSWSFIFFISFCASQVSKGIHLSHNRLFVLQFNMIYNTRLKLKLMTFIEKLLSKHLIIGFSVGPLFV